MPKFKKQERLKSRKLISKIFAEGQGFNAYPLRLAWTLVEKSEGDFPALFGVSVPKRRFKKAPDRNRLKRQIREAYRLHKEDFYTQIEQSEEQYALLFIYIGKEKLPYEDIEKAIKKALGRIGAQAK